MLASSARRGTRRGAAIAFAAVGVLAFAMIVVAADHGRLPPMIERLYRWPGGDKVGHLVLLALLAFALETALGGRRLRVGRLAIPIGVLALGVAITAEEVSQAFFPARTLSVVDLACSYFGIALGHLAATRSRGQSS